MFILIPFELFCVFLTLYEIKNEGFAGEFLESIKKMNDMMTKSFLSYVDLKKKAKIDIISEQKDLEKGIQEPNSEQCYESNLVFCNKRAQIKTRRDGTTIQPRYVFEPRSVIILLSLPTPSGSMKFI